MISRLLYKLTYLPCKLRKIFYKSFNPIYFYIAGARVGRGLCAFNRIYLSVAPSSNVEIGDCFVIKSGEGINLLSRNLRASIYVGHGANLKIGNNSGMSSASIWVNESITIGNNVNIGANSTIIDTDAHSLDWRVRMTTEDTFCAKNAPIVIGDGVFIGMGSIVLKGVTIGDHAVIGAGSVVTQSIPANCIAAGNPCKVVKYLND